MMNAKERRQKAEDEWIKFERDLNNQLEEKGTQYRLIYLPEKDLMPYNHEGTVTQLENRIDEIQQKMRDRKRQLCKNNLNPTDEPMEQITLDEEDADVLAIALMVYKSSLLAVHGRTMRSPVKAIIWEDDFGEGGTGYPKCPECHELAYGLDDTGKGRCPFCGQLYELDEEGKEKAEPNPEETRTCPNCKQDTLVGRRAKSNGHFHGRCTNCGCVIME